MQTPQIKHVAMVIDSSTVLLMDSPDLINPFCYFAKAARTEDVGKGIMKCLHRLQGWRREVVAILLGHVLIYLMDGEGELHFWKIKDSKDELEEAGNLTEDIDIIKNEFCGQLVSGGLLKNLPEFIIPCTKFASYNSLMAADGALCTLKKRLDEYLLRSVLDVVVEALVRCVAEGNKKTEASISAATMVLSKGVKFDLVQDAIARLELKGPSTTKLSEKFVENVVYVIMTGPSIGRRAFALHVLVSRICSLGHLKAKEAFFRAANKGFIPSAFTLIKATRQILRPAGQGKGLFEWRDEMFRCCIRLIAEYTTEKHMGQAIRSGLDSVLETLLDGATTLQALQYALNILGHLLKSPIAMNKFREANLIPDLLVKCARNPDPNMVAELAKWLEFWSQAEPCFVAEVLEGGVLKEVKQTHRNLRPLLTVAMSLRRLIKAFDALLALEPEEREARQERARLAKALTTSSVEVLAHSSLASPATLFVT